MNIQKQEIMDRMHRINRKLFTAHGHEDDAPIGKGQMHILKEIIENQKITQDELAKALNLDKTTIAKAVKRLEIKGLITRKRQEGDLRKKELIATEKAFVVEEKMKEHMINTTEAFFEGISEEALESFQDTLGKIETNIERERKMMHDKRRFGKQVLDLIEENKAITRENLADLLGKKGNKVSRVVDKLINEGFIEEKDGQLSLTQKAIDHKQHHEMDRKDHRKGHPGDKEGRPGYREAPPEHKAVIKMILDNQGIMKADLIEKSVMDAYEIEDLLNHLTREGVLEIKDDKIYADPEEFKGRHRH